MKEDTQYLWTQFFSHFIRDKKTASEDSHPFYRAIPGITAPPPEKKKKRFKIFLQLSCGIIKMLWANF